MLKEAIEKIVSLAAPTIREIEGSVFRITQDAEYALKLLSDITTGSKVTYNDNGIATSVVTKTVVALQTNESIRPIVSLRPYRTF